VVHGVLAQQVVLLGAELGESTGALMKASNVGCAAASILTLFSIRRCRISSGSMGWPLERCLANRGARCVNDFSKALRHGTTAWQ